MMQEFVQQITDTAKGIMNNMHTCIPGEIDSVDPSTCTATVLPKMMFKKPDGSKIEYPKISGVPILFPKVAGVEIAYPLQKGDGCLILVAEQSLDLWMYGQDTATDLQFDMSNSVCLPMLSNKPNSAFATACSTGSLVINGDVIIKGSLTTSGGTVNLN